MQLDHQRALMNTKAFNESIGRRQAEFELSRALRTVKETENSFGGQIGVLRERIMQTSDELQRSLEERSIFQSKLQNSQHQIMQLHNQLREVEESKAALELKKSFDSRNERVKFEMESEIRQLSRQLELAQESERNLQETAKRSQTRSDQSKREIMELERELRVLKSENSLLQSKLAVSSVAKGVSKSSVSVANKTNIVSSTPSMIPNIPTIKVPQSMQKIIPLEIADESPIVRRGKRNSNVNNKDQAVKVDSSDLKDNTETGVSVPDLALIEDPIKSPTKKIKVTENDSNSLNSALDGIGKRKIKLPERFSKSTVSSGFNPPSTPVNGDIPRSTPLSKSVNPTVMESIMSNFTVKIPTIKK